MLLLGHALDISPMFESSLVCAILFGISIWFYMAFKEEYSLDLLNNSAASLYGARKIMSAYAKFRIHFLMLLGLAKPKNQMIQNTGRGCWGTSLAMPQNVKRRPVKLTVRIFQNFNRFSAAKGK